MSTQPGKKLHPLLRLAESWSPHHLELHPRPSLSLSLARTTSSTPPSPPWIQTRSASPLAQLPPRLWTHLISDSPLPTRLPPRQTTSPRTGIYQRDQLTLCCKLFFSLL